MTNFNQIGDANLLAFKDNVRRTEVVAKKQEILDSIGVFHNLVPTTVLCVGFSSFLFASFKTPVAVTGISKEAHDYLISQQIKFTYIPESDIDKYQKKFQVVIAADEYFTYADSDQEQKDNVSRICNLATEYVITTLRDYKNQDYKDREFSQPSVVRTVADSTIFLENHTWDPRDRSSWNSIIYAILQGVNKLLSFGPFARRTMYFKQLANFSATAGATSFLVHKNLMYKGLVRKNYEHVITIKFD